ncbi:hypothetical protein P7L74_00655 (plasmid) [Tistrella mobilis]|jgi:hypothetical protein|uniref:hypothetical protein n=1 Tax=Tistrella mobilis TaxID=171437 RepID=UPI0035569BDA
MTDDRTANSRLQEDLAALKRQVHQLADRLSHAAHETAAPETLRAARHRAAALGADARRATREHPMTTGLIVAGVVGLAAWYLACRNGHDRSDSGDGRRHWY